MKWRMFLRARLARLAYVLTAITVLTFLMVHLAPGDPARLVAGMDADDNAVEVARQNLGLDRSLPAQFVSYVGGLFRGDLGTSFATRQPVTAEIAQKIGPTMELALIGMVLILLVGIPLGLLGAVSTRKGGRTFEVLFSSGTGAMAAIPQYLVATFLAFLFAVTWQIFPVAGAGAISAAILPAVAIAVRPAAAIARLVRVRTLEVLETPYVRTARSKRLPAWKLYGWHVFPNAITTMLAMGGVLFASLIGGAVIVEQVFARPGLGTALVNGVLLGDYPVVQGIVLLLGFSVVLVNALVDILLGVVDPRTMEAGR
ncbi:ABC transporter permease [Aeromicrobium halocynthiae]|uniref:ABC transporter permease n=1 Tax=Aeromicrobium halocynthiae TaxID=560557 RepID=A0ABN2VWN9_9ACTN